MAFGTLRDVLEDLEQIRDECTDGSVRDRASFWTNWFTWLSMSGADQLTGAHPARRRQEWR
jgi:hypothetical protein